MKIVGENDIAWIVECEHGGCVNKISVPKKIRVPINHGESEVRMARKPSPRWCVLHQPRRS